MTFHTIVVTTKEKQIVAHVSTNYHLNTLQFANLGNDLPTAVTFTTNSVGVGE